jgi:hypothetical protein
MYLFFVVVVFLFWGREKGYLYYIFAFRTGFVLHGFGSHTLIFFFSWTVDSREKCTPSIKYKGEIIHVTCM